MYGYITHGTSLQAKICLSVALIQANGGQDWTPVRSVLFEPGSDIFSQSHVQSNFAISKKLAHEAMIQFTPPRHFFTPNELDSYLSLIKPTSTTKYILIPMTTPLFDLLWPQPVTKYTLTPIFIPDGGSKAWHTILGDSSLGWTWEGLEQVPKMMQRKDTTSKGMKFRIWQGVLRIGLCARQEFACERAAHTIKTSRRWKVLWSASWWCSPV